MRDRGLCFFAHYDRDGLVADHVLFYLRALKDAGFKTTLLSTAALDDTQRKRAAQFCEKVVVRQNRGLDFGSWADAFAKHPANAGVPILLANDSVYGPLDDLSTMIDRLLTLPADVHGMIRTAEIDVHLQSWFIHLNAGAADHPKVREFFRQDFGNLSKDRVILLGEVGFSQMLRANGLRLAALYESTPPSRHLPMETNFSHFLWQELIRDGVPFLKVELLRENPMGIEGISQWRKIVGLTQPELVPMIDDHLERVGRAADGPRFSAVPRMLHMERFVHREYYYRAARRPLLRLVNAFAWQIMRKLRDRFPSLRV